MLKIRAFIFREKKSCTRFTHEKKENSNPISMQEIVIFFSILGVARREYGTLRLSPLCEEGKKQPANYV